MIVSEKKTIEEVLRLIEDKDKIFIIGCGDCATACRSGGLEDIPPFVEQLLQHGKTVLGWIVPTQSCMLQKTRLELKAVSSLISQSDVVITLSCGAGAQTIIELLNDKLVVPGTNTLFLAMTKRAGEFVQLCSMCGDCVLEITGGICPQSRCAKSLMNGPCSGSVDGKCETYRDRDCAWHEIYQRLKKLGKLENFQIRLPMKDYSRLRNQAEMKVQPLKISKKEGKQ